MRSILRLGLVVLGLLLAHSAPASATDCTSGTPAHTCYWIGGTGTWDNSTTTHWSYTTGGSTCTCLPGSSADLIVLDGSSGGGTVTVDSTLAGATFGTLTIGAFTGTLDNSVNNSSMTFTNEISLTGAGTKTFKMGSATYTLVGNTGVLWDCGTCTNLTLTAGTSTILLSQATPVAQRSFTAGGKTYATVSIAPSPSATIGASFLFSTNSATFGTLSITGPNWINFTTATTTTITNAFDWTQTSAANAILITGGNGTKATISSANNGTMTWATLVGLSFTGGGTFTANNSTAVGYTSGITVTNPSLGGGHIIGG